jgi:hypothetical protein
VSRLAILALVLVCSCERARRADLYCGKLAALAGAGLNPALPTGRYLCYDDKATCDAQVTGCAGVAPAWYCFAIKSSRFDPLDGTDECLPSAQMCDASRPRALDEGVTECTANEHAFCATRHHFVQCASSKDACEQLTDFDAKVAHETNFGACMER